MRSVLAAGAALWFIYNTAFFIPDGIVRTTDAGGGLDGDPSAFAVMSAARALFFGLTLISLALIDWATVARRIGMGPDE